ncbi:hypothetical protein, conserved [Thermococcus kodakarensis KOD1]|uniref:DUF2110 family protein n=1 Tax=Thermococcus kodakarensis (strain ATCC BAA-918 / JCM 12380 / KOD1) TaxID=69014 RepID=Q5JDD6_THEKO|nr:DUF2110 family protein [Thermococcus kodakarensis]WCN29434.1 DUF2110 family protein [Thermococcus kodakarensis]WCN31717.1 DUF2110 family protein [Thermococcus kodakarensis]BAD86212.1 hypothetical protein, conserved [Thermococcus kodakarensis KOD1]
MREVVILEKVYGDRSGFEKLNKKLRSLLGELDVEWKLSAVKKNWVKVTLSGEDEEVSANLVREEFGEVPYSLKNVEEGQSYRGRFIDLGKVGYGAYVDIGVFRPAPKDALLPLYYLKKTFGDIPVRGMIRRFGWVDNLPVEVEVTRVEFGAREVELAFTEEQLKRIKSWISDGFDKLFVVGTISEKVEEALIRTGHGRDVKRLEELGLMETLLVLKKGTQAPGIIKAIGPHLPGAVFGAIKFEEKP